MSDGSAPASLSPIQTELLKRVDDIFAAIGAATKTAVNAAQTQLPDLAKEYVAYGRLSATVLEVVLLLAMIGCVYLGIRAQRYINKTNDWDYFPLHFPGAIVGGFCSIFFFCHISNLLMVWFAPKIWLLLEIKSLL